MATVAERTGGNHGTALEGHRDRERWPLGDGVGKWRLSVDASQSVRRQHLVPVDAPGVLVQSLLKSPTGHLTNLSSAPRAGAHR